LERVKWTLWHGKPQEALSKLELDDECHGLTEAQEIRDLYDYLNRNQAYQLSTARTGDQWQNPSYLHS